MNSNKYKDSYYELREITDLKDMVDSSARLFKDHVAYYVKEKRGGEYKPVYYPEVKADVDALGTRLLDMGLKDEKIAVIGENSYEWIISYWAVTNGTGVIVPLDKELSQAEIINLMNRAEISAIIYSGKKAKLVDEAAKAVPTLKYRISFAEEEHSDDVFSWKKLKKEGADLVEDGDRSFIDAKIDREAM